MAFSGGVDPHLEISYAGAAATGIAGDADDLERAVTPRCDPACVEEALDRSLSTRLDVDPHSASAAVETCLDGGRIEVERLPEKGSRRFDARASVVYLEAPRRAEAAGSVPCAILLMVVRKMTPAVRSDDVLAGLRLAALSQESPQLVDRLAQGPLDETTGRLADPLGTDRESGVVRDVIAPATPVEDEDIVVGARPPR